MAAEDPEKLAAELDAQAEDMQRRNDQLGDEVAQTREDWERKRRDPSVPGAPPPAEQRSDEAGQAPGSAGPEAPPTDAHPAEAQAPSETAVGPPADDA